jgi:hypothetical protein
MACPCEHGNEPAGFVKEKYFLTNSATVSFSRRALLHEVRELFLKILTLKIKLLLNIIT